jgi:hypothetical protein
MQEWGYLYYSKLPKKKRNGQEEKGREFIKPDSILKLTLIGKDEVLNHYIASLWALVFLGGFGARSRRGGGNLAVVGYDLEDLEKISFIPTSDFCEWFVKNLKEAKHLVGSSKGSCDKYSNLSNVKLVLSKTKFNTWYEALNDIGKKFMNFRIENRQRVFDTAVFGLPLRYGKHKAVEVENTKEDITRRSSPVIIKVVKNSEGKYQWMVLRLWGKFLPDGAKLSFMGETQEPTFDLVKEFFQELEGRDEK